MPTYCFEKIATNENDNNGMNFISDSTMKRVQVSSDRISLFLLLSALLTRLTN